MRKLHGSCGGAARHDFLVTWDAAGPFGNDKDQGARATHKTAKKRGLGQKRKDGLLKASREKVKEGGDALSGFNRRTGRRKRFYKCDSVYHTAPTCPWRDAPPEQGRADKPSFSTISMEAPVWMKKANQ